MITEFFNNLWTVTESLGVWFLFGLLIAALMHGFVPANLFKRWLGKNSFLNVIKAAFIGVPMPLCSCGVVPTVIALKKKGASNSSCLSFLVSTPQTGVDSLLVSASFLSWPFAIFKLISAFIIGILGGGIHLILHKKQLQQSEATEEPKSTPAAPHQRPSTKDLYDFAVNDLFYNLWKWMLAGIVAAALISTFVSDEFLSNSFFADPVLGSIAALFLSIPLYVCATSSVPIAAALVLKGMSPAVAIVFLIAGPATNIATIGLIYKSFGKLFTTVYLASVSIGSIICALFFSSLISIDLPDTIHHHGGANIMELIGAIIFSLLLLSFAYRDIKSWFQTKRSSVGDSITLSVNGINCQGCVGKLRKAINKEYPNAIITGDPDANTLTVTHDSLDRKILKSTITDSGFSVNPTE